MRRNDIKIYVAALLMAGTSAVAARDFRQSFLDRKAASNDKSEFEKVDALPKGAERSMMEFLYSYLSLPDLADYPAEFYLRNVETSLKAREEMPWGKSVPEREFLHFVLPVRVNNENLDMSREVFYEELKDRVKGMTMEEAILEVNHWCHEKVTYKPSDARTSSPLSSVSQAIGRCGEEPTFAVAALRSVGIPARQVYTPRWAHTDDNHAWVEAWADGKWHFIGACEPEPVLDLAWFNAPASRGMLMNTNVFGDYDGPEEVLDKSPLITKINVTENYAPTSTLMVKVTDSEGQPVKDAGVNFCIYNYAEYYPVANKTTGPDGVASLLAGSGDMIIWASDGNKFGVAKGKPAAGDTLLLTLDRPQGFVGEMEFNITPPPGGTNPPLVTQAQREINNRRFSMEDSIRNAYTSTFADEKRAYELAELLGVSRDELKKILTESRGNHTAISGYLSDLTPEKRQDAVSLLMNVSEKDRRDISMDVVEDCIAEYPYDGSNMTDEYAAFTDKYVLNPRIENEGLRADRKYLRGLFGKEEAGEIRRNPQKLAAWIAERVRVTDDENPQNLRMSVQGLLSHGRGNELSRNILYVKTARSLGIPARIDPVTGVTQYAGKEMRWIDVDFGNAEKETEGEYSEKGQGSLRLTYRPIDYLEDPKYYTHFSISRIENGMPRLLEFDETATTAASFTTPYSLAAGDYILTTGRRLADGSVLARTVFFNIENGKEKTVPMVIREDESAISVIGSLNAENIYHDIEADEDKSILSTTGRGYYVAGIISPGHEPSAHALNDISAVADKLDATGRKLLVFFESEEGASRFERQHFGKLPENLVWGIDKDGVTKEEIIKSLNLASGEKPLFVIADTFNRIVFVSQGYTIGLGEKLLQTLGKLKE